MKWVLCLPLVLLLLPVSAAAQGTSLVLNESFEDLSGIQANGGNYSGIEIVDGRVGNGSLFNSTGSWVRYPTSIVNLAEGAIDFYMKPMGWNWGDESQRVLLQIRTVAKPFWDNQTDQFLLIKSKWKELNFIIYDSDGSYHRAKYYLPSIAAELQDSEWVRITLDWKNVNSGESNSEIHLYVNGKSSKMGTYFIYPEGSTYADYNSTNTEINYQLGAWMYIGNDIKGGYPAGAVFDELKVHNRAIGMPNRGNISSMEGNKSPAWQPPPGRIVTLAQAGIPAGPNSNAKDDELIGRICMLESEYFDAFETGTGSIANRPFEKWAACRGKFGLDVCLSSWWSFVDNILGKQRAIAEQLLPNGSFVKQNISYLATGNLDKANRSEVGKAADALEAWLINHPGFSYYFDNENTLEKIAWPGPLNYWESPTYSDAGLQYFREYMVENYGPEYADARFPVGKEISITPQNSYKIAYSDDAAYWAKWLEWRTVVFANYMNEVSAAFREANGNNTEWKGFIFFVSFGDFMNFLSGVDIGLISRLPYVDWIVMEERNINSSDEYPSPGIYQLEQASRILNGTNTLLGGYVLAHHYYANPPRHNSLGSVERMFNETVKRGAKMVVVYSDHVITPVEYPSYIYNSTPYQNVTYNESISELWVNLTSEIRLCNDRADLNCDDAVDLADIAISANNFGRKGIVARMDVDDNEEIDIYDLVFVASRLE